MALYTPLARLGTFLFPSQSRRISAPPPESPYDSKRRPAIASCDSPPRCRRRLSFADSDQLPDNLVPSIQPALHSHVKALADLQDPEQKILRWKEIAHLATSATPHQGFDDPVVANVFDNALANPLSPSEYVALVTAMRAVLDTSRPLGMREEHMVARIMDAFVTHVHADGVIPLVTGIVLRNDWGRMFAGMTVWAKVAACLVNVLGAEGIQIAEWDPAMRLLAECGRVEVMTESVRRIVANLERLAEACGDSLEGALRALYRILVDVQVAREFVLADTSMVVAEVSAVHAKNLGVQHACVDVLVRLASAKVLRRGS